MALLSIELTPCLYRNHRLRGSEYLKDCLQTLPGASLPVITMQSARCVGVQGYFAARMPVAFILAARLQAVICKIHLNDLVLIIPVASLAVAARNDFRKTCSEQF